MQAGKKMQRYLVMSFVLVLLAAVASAYAWQSPEEMPELVGVLKHAKPNPDIFEATEVEEPAADDAPETVTINLTPPSEKEAVFSAADLLESQDEPEPVQEEVVVGQVVPENPVADDSQLGDIAFSLDISGNYQAVDPGYQFAEGFYTLYATFAYRGMADGTNWAWSWQRNGSEIEGGNQVWSYGQEGPGYIYFKPEEGFRSGEYSLAIWVGDELQSQSGFNVASGVAASN
jgi:hypothetical protein